MRVADILGLNVAEGNLVAGDVEIRSAASDALGLVGSRDSLADSLK